MANSGTEKRLPEPPPEPSDEAFLAPHYYATLCQVCKSSDVPKLKRCSSCKLVRYCSTVHQKEHWPLHKEFCRALKNISSFVQLINVYDKHFIANVIAQLERELRRPLYIDELEMLQFQEHCNYCKSLNCDLFICCDVCKAVSYCDDNHRALDEFHRNSCFELGLARLCYVHGIKWKTNQNNLDGLLLRSSMLECLEAAQVFPEALKFFKNKTLASLGGKDLVQLANLSERLSYPYTFSYAIQKCYLAFREVFVVHIVGAEAYIETLNLGIWSVILEQLKELTRHLDIYLIGASLIFGENYKIVKGNSSITFHVIPSLYETFCSSESYVKPDAVICFNCGIHERGPWIPALEYLMPAAGIPLMITSYTLEECLQDVATIKEYHKKCIIVQEPIPNPFASLRPYRNWNGNVNNIHNGLTFPHNAALAVLQN